MGNIDFHEILADVNELNFEDNDRRREEYEQRSRELKIGKEIHKLHCSCPRHAKSTVNNFEVEVHSKAEVVRDRIVKICHEMRQFLIDRKQLFLYGSVGTGKDHLAVACLRQAARCDATVEWAEGLDIYEQIAGAYSLKRSQSDIYAEYVRPQVLVISDPVFAANWSEAKAEALRKLVRKRYDRKKATWVTCNIPKLSEAESYFGTDTFSRLSERTEFIECRWKDYRQQ